MGAKVSRQNFVWVGSDEPHATRRKLILDAHPEIKQLMGVDWLFKWLVTGVVLFQFLSFVLVSKYVESIWLLVVLAYCVGGVANHSLMLAVHEISHNQAFGPSYPLANRAFGMFANLPLGVPMSVSFKRYHLEHHRYQGDDILDTDIPSEFETRFFTNTAMKVLWVILQPLFYTIRPLMVHPKTPSTGELVNLAVQMTFNYLVVHYLGGHVLAYALTGSLLAMGLHPVAGHFISEHYLMHDYKGSDSGDSQPESADLKDNPSAVYVDKEGRLMIPETCSYYGPLNWVTFWVGYHVEHHDFPSIPGRRLAQVARIAPEFYCHLHHHTSWVQVIWQYITDPTVGPYSRVKRPHRPLETRSAETKKLFID